MAVREWGSESRVIRLEEMPRRSNKNGSESRDVGRGTIATGEHVRIHQSTQPAGIAPAALHTIEHTEMICVREGVVEVRHSGRTDRAEVGDVIFIPKGTVHAISNVGSGPASYFVVAVGGDVEG